MIDDSRDKKAKRQQSGDHNGKGLDGEAQKHIGRMLKATYEQIAHEPVPDKFLALLKQLEASEPRK
ncbi:MAG TPA: NepR family anti-sigma factor [Aestuariivirgaceae bacterium]|nr:NepR family anti-sigma factor [Aestuariivirgaceae bacterium]